MSGRTKLTSSLVSSRTQRLHEGLGLGLGGGDHAPWEGQGWEIEGHRRRRSEINLCPPGVTAGR